MSLLDKVYKPARSNIKSWNLAKTLFQTAIFWLIFLWILPKLLVHMEHKIFNVTYEGYYFFGWTMFVIFSILGLYSGYTMSSVGKGTPLPLDCPQKLVVAGPYKFVRNPMAVAGIGQGISVGIIYGSVVVIIYALAGAFLWHYLVRPSEEVDLRNRFGDAYNTYCKDVRCWIPRVK